MKLQLSTTAGQSVLGGAQFGWAKPWGGGPGENPQKNFEIFIPEIAANASNFKN